MARVMFAVIVGNEVAGTVSFEDDSPVDAIQRFISAYRSNPIIVEATDTPDVAFGWTWDGSSFISPESK